MTPRAGLPADPVPPGPAGAGDSGFDASAFEQSLDRRLPTRWIGWRLRLLVLAALLGCVAVFAVMRYVAASPSLDAAWQLSPQGQPILIASRLPALQPMVGRVLTSLHTDHDPPLVVDDLLLQRSARWLVTDGDAFIRLQQQLAERLAQGRVTLRFEDGHAVTVDTPPRGYAGLGLPFWPLAGLGLVLYLIGAAVLLMRPVGRNLLYATMAVSQAGNLLLIAAELARGIGQPSGFPALDLLLRLGFDVVSAAAAVCVFALHPRRVPGAALWIGSAVAAAVGWAALAASGALQPLWPPTQGLVVVLGTVALGLVSWSYRLEANPFAAVMRRLALAAMVTLAGVTVAAVATARQPGAAQGVAAVGAVIWYLFFASLLLLVPFLSRAKDVLREFALLAGISTITTSLDLLFVALFSLGPFASLTLAMFLALGVYAGARQWLLNKTVGARVMTTERTFEQLYRVAREVQVHPDRQRPLCSALLRDLFDPIEVLAVTQAMPRARVAGGGSALFAPLPSPGDAPHEARTLVLRFANRGQRLFTHEDARLCDRIAEQLRNAMAYDQAVERGRLEERQRIAQDLHDDIGARLLTLMYKAQSPEMEDYVRHTLQDLKTLTRGLAAAEHRLSHAASEWKVDLAHRLSAAGLQLVWSFRADEDISLTVVQWSGLTRILRELVSNTIYHSHAQVVEVSLQLQAGAFEMRVSDDGDGRAPETWSHGLGLGGIRKRVKLLGGQVAWHENAGRGVHCSVHIPRLVAA